MSVSSLPEPATGQTLVNRSYNLSSHRQTDNLFLMQQISVLTSPNSQWLNTIKPSPYSSMRSETKLKKGEITAQYYTLSVPYCVSMKVCVMMRKVEVSQVRTLCSQPTLTTMESQYQHRLMAFVKVKLTQK